MHTFFQIMWSKILSFYVEIGYFQQIKLFPKENIQKSVLTPYSPKQTLEKNKHDNFLVNSSKYLEGKNQGGGGKNCTKKLLAYLGLIILRNNNYNIFFLENLH